MPEHDPHGRRTVSGHGDPPCDRSRSGGSSRPSPRAPGAPPERRRRSDGWLERWLDTCSDLARLQATNPMLDAVIDEIDGRRIRIGDHWLSDFASCNYLGFDLEPEIMDSIEPQVRRWGTHPSWSRLLGSPTLYEDIEDQLTELLGAPDTLVLPTITHIHMSVIPVLAGGGTIFLDRRAHKTIYDGTKIASSNGARVQRYEHDDLEPPRGAAERRSRRPPADLHGRRQQHDRQRPRPPRLRRPGPRARRPPLRRRRPRLRRHRRARPTTSPATGAAGATASSATSARATTTSCSSAGSPSRTRRCWRSSPCPPG